jgi:hypothetical protein
MVLLQFVETIMFKAPDGTKAKLKRLNQNVSALLRGQVDKLLSDASDGTAHTKASGLCGVFTGPANASTTRDYLKQYAPKGAH